MNERLRSRLEKSLGNHSGGQGKSRAVSGAGKTNMALIGAARGLLERALNHARIELPDAKIDRDALETASLALLLPFCSEGGLRQSSMGVFSITERCNQAAELLIGIASTDTPEEFIDRVTRILSECPRKTTTLAEARVLSDAINIEDFGISGLCRSAAMLVRAGGDLSQLAEAFNKREQYGYWEARLKDGFHFESTRKLAQARLKIARESIRQLLSELAEDLP